MAVSIDIAGAVAPAAARPGKAGEAREGATRSANSAGKTRSRGAHASKSAKGESGTPNAFDAQLDAVLPDADGTGKTKGKAAAGDAQQAAPGGRDSEEQPQDQVVTGAVLTPWTFVQPVDATPTPTVSADSVAAPSAVDAASGPAAAEHSGAQSAASSTTPDVGGEPRSGPGNAAAGIQTPPPVIADSAAAQPAPEKVTTTRLVDVPAPKAAAGKIDSSDQVSAVPPASVLEQRSTPESVAVRDQTVGKPATAAPSSTTVTEADATSAGVTPAVSSSNVEPSAATAPASIPEPTAASTQSADVPAMVAPAPPIPTTVNAAMAEQASADVQAAAVAADVPSAARVPANVMRGDELPVKGRSTAAHVQQRHDFQMPVSRDAEEGQRGAAVEASANVTAVDDQRRNGSSPDADLSGSKPSAVTAGSDIPPHEALPPASATRVIHPTVSAMPASDGVRQVPVDGTPLAEATTAPAADVPDADTPHRLVQSLRMQFMRGGGDAIVQLRPEHLGQVTVSLRVEQGSVAARITAADPVVAEWLQAHQDSLRDGLQANGLTLDRLSIDRDARSPDRRERREPPPRQRFRPAAETQSTFELTI